MAVDADGDAFVVWESYRPGRQRYGIYGQRFNAAGMKVGGEFQVNTYTTSQQMYPSVAVDADGDAFVIWESYGQDGSGFGIYGQRFDAAGMKVGGEFQINTYTTSISIFHRWRWTPTATPWSCGKATARTATGYGIYGQRFNSAGVKVGGEFQINTYTTNDQRYRIGGDGRRRRRRGRVGKLRQDGSSYGIYGQRFNSAGMKVGVRVSDQHLHDEYQQYSHRWPWTPTATPWSCGRATARTAVLWHLRPAVQLGGGQGRRRVPDQHLHDG